MAQGRSTEIISMIEWIRTSSLSIKNFLFSVAGTNLPAIDLGGGTPASIMFVLRSQTLNNPKPQPSNLNRKPSPLNPKH